MRPAKQSWGQSKPSFFLSTFLDGGCLRFSEHEFYYIFVLLFRVMRGDGSLPRKARTFLPVYVYSVATVCPNVAGAAGTGTRV